jgi:hypothetical protein
MAKFTEAPADTPFNRRLAEGHLNRTGHKMNLVQVSDDGILWTNVRLCCGETIPETVDTWQEKPTPSW